MTFSIRFGMSRPGILQATGRSVFEQWRYQVSAPILVICFSRRNTG